MSVEKYEAEAIRWLSQAQSDLKASRISKQSEVFEWSCFQAQQAGEKALKALWFFLRYDPWGHSVLKLIEEFPSKPIHEQLQELRGAARTLDKLCIPTRYPNGLPELTPADIYDESDAEHAIVAAEQLISWVENYLRSS